MTIIFLNFNILKGLASGYFILTFRNGLYMNILKKFLSITFYLFLQSYLYWLDNTQIYLFHSFFRMCIIHLRCIIQVRKRWWQLWVIIHVGGTWWSFYWSWVAWNLYPMKWWLLPLNLLDCRKYIFFYHWLNF